jgi:hypothetical protein
MICNHPYGVVVTTTLATMASTFLCTPKIFTPDGNWEGDSIVLIMVVGIIVSVGSGVGDGMGSDAGGVLVVVVGVLYTVALVVFFFFFLSEAADTVRGSG